MKLFITTDVVTVIEHKLASVTTTEYVPPANNVTLGMFGVADNEPNPFGPVHEYEVPPLAVRLSVEPWHFGLSLPAVAIGEGLAVTLLLLAEQEGFVEQRSYVVKVVDAETVLLILL